MSQFDYEKNLCEFGCCLMYFDDAVLPQPRLGEPGTYSVSRPGSWSIALKVSPAPAANSVSAL